MPLTPGHSMKAWRREAGRAFSICGAATCGAMLPPVNEDQFHLWMYTASWTYCPHCGLRSPDARVLPGWRQNGAQQVAQHCSGGCDLSPLELQIPVEGDGQCLRGAKLLAYVTPATDHWQRWAEHLEFRACTAGPLIGRVWRR